MKKKMNHTEYQKKLKTKTKEMLEYTIKDASEAIKADPDNPNCGYYQDEISYCMMELRYRNNTNEKKLKNNDSIDVGTKLWFRGNNLWKPGCGKVSEKKKDSSGVELFKFEYASDSPYPLILDWMPISNIEKTYRGNYLGGKKRFVTASSMDRYYDRLKKTSKI